MSFWDAFFLLLIYVPLIMLWIFAVMDIFGRDDMSGVSKALWVAVVILLPYLGTLIYLLTRRPTAQERAALDEANRDVLASSSPPSSAEQISTLADLHDRGKLSDTEFASEKARILGVAPAPALAPATA
jgi:hypothetical protein